MTQNQALKELEKLSKVEFVSVEKQMYKHGNSKKEIRYFLYINLGEGEKNCVSSLGENVEKALIELKKKLKKKVK